MVELIPSLEPRNLLPPLLACLPTAFVSSQPPPALLPLLSPIIRQRVKIFTTVSASPTDSWLRLLCWDSASAERLQSLVDGASFEPHPVSGEIDLPDEIPVRYKRVDEETLQSQVQLPEYSLKVIYVWCPEDQEGGGPAWRVAEVLPQDSSVGEDGAWSISIGEANVHQSNLRAAGNDSQTFKANTQSNGKEAQEEEDDDDYWAQYDATPGRTPGVKTPAPKGVSSLQQSDADYYSQYDDVQPAMDNHDPEEEQPEIGPSSLNGDMLARLLQRQVSGSGAESSAHPAEHPASAAMNGDYAMSLNHPRPSSISSGSSDPVAKLEQEAENQSAYEVGVKQHISSNLKSLFRLAKATGMSRSDFQALVKTELELLNLSDGE
ncbi:uncharacterized protein BP01DRAFT_338193 [Aspergillus saccharolyticus JOP 1030-1]|uniref:Uncharacterized protein n=1 Tax=Aspergillus saccharolyticus JOP 1030-1 TaxID=1450539 RepID=A0A318ZQH2_9EURO|nr:hypothetical protein BP01DRAFT_338193 [Aspergillus saccharolyticus JOP 1030-1]PYH46643.1 hypothetical protein BP01DRAFT_338193 [Aspergillus saccharolyticus JOP 1030-1]